MQKKMWGVLFLAGLLFVSAKITDSILRIGESGTASEILFSGGDGILRYNTTDSRWESSDDGLTFKIFGGIADTDAVIYKARIFNDLTPTTENPNPVLSVVSQGPVDWIDSTTTNGCGVGFVDLIVKEGIFAVTPLCWFSTVGGLAGMPGCGGSSSTKITTIRETFGNVRQNNSFDIWCQAGD